MINDQTVERYLAIKNVHPDCDRCGVFFAFDNEQFAEGYKRLVELGHIKDGEKVLRSYGGAFGTKEGLDKFFGFYKSQDEIIKNECDPQEVYFYEFNNHESQISWDGDLEAIKITISIFGEEAAHRIKRYCASMSVDDLVRKPIKVKGLYFWNNENETVRPKNLWFSDNAECKGKCYTMLGGLLYTVCTMDGETYFNEDLAGLSASYDGETIYNYRKE